MHTSRERLQKRFAVKSTLTLHVYNEVFQEGSHCDSRDSKYFKHQMLFSEGEQDVDSLTKQMTATTGRLRERGHLYYLKQQQQPEVEKFIEKENPLSATRATADAEIEVDATYVAVIVVFVIEFSSPPSSPCPST
uniref:Uncharacterized protein n=1 Tax=Glossina austeni TaxID=7395 RepID=A0A1A9VFX5_GLOAU